MDTANPDFNAAIEESQESKARPDQDILDLVGHDNIADVLDDAGENGLLAIGRRVVEDYETDKASRVEWEEKVRKAKELAALQGPMTSSFPFVGATNPKIPLLAEACTQFSARAMPGILKDGDPVKGRVWGSDEGGKKEAARNRISTCMNYQLMEETEDWIQGLDKLLVEMPMVGSGFKKVYYDPVQDMNVSEFVSSEDLVVDYYAKSLKRAARVTHVYYLYPHEIEEKMRSGEYRATDLKTLGQSDLQDSKPRDQIMGQDQDSGAQNDSLPHEILEQHRWLDLDQDGLPEPYIVFVHRVSQYVFRITPRYQESGVVVDPENNIVTSIAPEQHFVQYIFMESPDGGFYGMGWGTQYASTNETINALYKQLLDAGILANAPGGIRKKGMRILNNDMTIVPGEWKEADVAENTNLRDYFFPLPVKEPSSVLATLADKLMQYGQRALSNVNVMAGESPGANVPATTTVALIQQAMQQFTAIYGRIYRGLKQEFKLLARLNFLYLSPEKYRNILDIQDADPEKDFDTRTCDVLPAADPRYATNVQKLFMAQIVESLLNKGYDDQELRKRLLEYLGVEDHEKLLPKPDTLPQIDPVTEIKLKELELKSVLAQIELKRVENDSMRVGNEIAGTKNKMAIEIEMARAKIADLQADVRRKDRQYSVSEKDDEILKLSEILSQTLNAMQEINPGARGKIPGPDVPGAENA